MTGKKSKQEISSGGIVYRIKNRQAEILLLKDPKENWTFPKGLVEKNEDIVDAAKREIAEESGVNNLIFKKELEAVNYTYTYESTVIYKTVHFFLFETDSSQKPRPQHEEGITAAKFFEINKVRSILGYAKTNLPIFNLAESFINSHKA